MISSKNEKRRISIISDRIINEPNWEPRGNGRCNRWSTVMKGATYTHLKKGNRYYINDRYVLFHHVVHFSNLWSVHSVEVWSSAGSWNDDTVGRKGTRRMSQLSPIHLLFDWLKCYHKSEILYLFRIEIVSLFDSFVVIFMLQKTKIE